MEKKREIKGKGEPLKREMYKKKIKRRIDIEKRKMGAKEARAVQKGPGRRGRATPPLTLGARNMPGAPGLEL